MPLLKSRALLNRLDPSPLEMPHADLLYPARMWKLRLGSCRLAHLEEALGTSGGRLRGPVPQAYFQFIKDRNFEPLERVLRHNRQDILSLAQLFFFLCKAYGQPEEIPHGQDLLSLARFYERKGLGAQAAKCYRLCAKGATRPEAFEGLASQSRRLGKVEQALRLSAMLSRDRPAQAAEALAKLYEHHFKDFPKPPLHPPGLAGDTSPAFPRTPLYKSGELRYNTVMRACSASKGKAQATKEVPPRWE